MGIIRVDALSKCLRNVKQPRSRDNNTLEGKMGMMQSYLFHLAFENSREEDYITKKLWGTLAAGVLPVYYGAPNVRDHAPPNSIILKDDFNSTKELGLYMNKVTANKTLYESYHAWRKKPLPEWFHRKYYFRHSHSICRLCRWAYAKKYGLGWNHKNQTVQDPVVSRNVKYDAASERVIHPYRESWSTLGKEGWRRSVFEHDGVIDIWFEASPQSNKEVFGWRLRFEEHFTHLRPRLTIHSCRRMMNHELLFWQVGMQR